MTRSKRTALLALEGVEDGLAFGFEGVGLIRGNVLQGGPEIYFFEQTAPIEDFFQAAGFVEPYPSDMVGNTVQTSTSAFTLIIDAFDLGQTAGTGGTSPVTDFEWFENVS